MIRMIKLLLKLSLFDQTFLSFLRFYSCAVLAHYEPENVIFLSATVLTYWRTKKNEEQAVMSCPYQVLGY